MSRNNITRIVMLVAGAALLGMAIASVVAAPIKIDAAVAPVPAAGASTAATTNTRLYQERVMWMWGQEETEAEYFLPSKNSALGSPEFTTVPEDSICPSSHRRSGHCSAKC